MKEQIWTKNQEAENIFRNIDLAIIFMKELFVNRATAEAVAAPTRKTTKRSCTIYTTAQYRLSPIFGASIEALAGPSPS